MPVGSDIVQLRPLFMQRIYPTSDLNVSPPTHGCSQEMTTFRDHPLRTPATLRDETRAVGVPESPS